jgi:hypothetical protein
VWDLYLWGGPDVVYRFSLSVLKHFESELLSLNFEDALSFINELPKRRIDTDELIKVRSVPVCFFKSYARARLHRN